MVMKSHHKKLISFKLLWCVMLASSGLGYGANAASFVNVSDTVSTSVMSAEASHSVVFTNTIPLVKDDYIEMVFNSAFTLSNDAANVSCPMNTISTVVMPSAVRCVATDSFNPAVHSFTVSKVLNPASEGGYGIEVSTHHQDGSVLEWSRSIVFINEVVNVTASVLPRLEFVIQPLGVDVAVNGASTTIAAGTSSINFGNLNFSATTTIASSSIAGQQLSVTTNAKYGFSVTVEQDQDLTSGSGAIIDPFANGFAQSVAVNWELPSANLDDVKTYGHFGFTTDDDTLSGSAFGLDKWKGFSGTSTMEVMHHTGSADGLTQGKGLAKVAYQIQVSALQEAGDYSNTLTYICTPTY